MRILLFNEYYPPDTSATAGMARVVAEALSEWHDVVVLAGRPSYDPAERPARYLFHSEQQGKIRICRVGSSAFSRRGMAGRLCNYLSYLACAVPAALVLRADLILSMTDPPFAGIAAALVARLRGLPLVYNIRDLYPDMAVGGEILRSPWISSLWERLHRWALGKASRIIVLGEDMRDRIAAKGVDPCRIAVVRDGPPIALEIPPEIHPVIGEIRGDFRFVALHAGNIGFYGAWETLVRAAREVQGTGIGLIFIGEGAQKERVESMAAGCSAVRFLPYRPVNEVPLVLAAADVHVITIRPGLEGVVVPSKLYPILAAGRPVLAVAPEGSDVAQIVRRAGCGIIANPENPSEVAGAIRELARDPGRLAEMGRRAREAAREFEPEIQMRLFVETVEHAWAELRPDVRAASAEVARPAPAGRTRI
ncbi:MAG: glycosyltransferase family 4 protein [Candidatus Acidiferrales bacterium]